MRVVLLLLALVQVALLGYVIANQGAARPAGPVAEREDRSAAILAKLALFSEKDDRQVNLVRDLQKEVSALEKELTGLRETLARIDERGKTSAEELRATPASLVRIGTDVQKLEKKLDSLVQVPAPAQPMAPVPGQPPAPMGAPGAPPDNKQLAELSQELRLLNERFKRVIDFAAGRSGLE